MFDPVKIRERFAQVVRGPAERIDLAEAALLIAAEEEPQLDLDYQLGRVEWLAREVRGKLAAGMSESGKVRVLLDYLFVELGVHGNTRHYYDPRNSFLNEVIERRLGIPISLAVLCMEVGRRAGVVLQGVGFPSHFLMKFSDGGVEYFIDPFQPERFLREKHCRELLQNLSAGRQPFDASFLDAVGPRQILTRLLANLKNIYLHRGDLARAVAAIDRILLLNPGESGEYRDRGLIHYKMASYGRAVADLERYVAQEPHAADRDSILAQAAKARQQMMEVN